MIHVKTDEIYGKNVIVNSNDFRGHILSIDSRFRKSSLEPSSDFMYELEHTYKNVIKARVASVEIPIGFYNFSKVKRNTMFRIDVVDYEGHVYYLEIEIPDGDYTPCMLINAIQCQLNGVRDMYGIFFRICLDEVSRRVTIVHDGSAPPPCPLAPVYCPVPFAITFMMMGLEDRKYDFGLGYNLGFNKQVYEVSEPFSITGESLINTDGENYFLLQVDDMHTVSHRTQNTFIECLAKILIKRDHRNGIIFDDGYTVLSNEFTFARPVDMKRMRIRLLDVYGEVVDLHNMNFSISLEVTEVMNVQLYDNYRTYLWNEKEPMVVRNVSGSASGLVTKNFN